MSSKPHTTSLVRRRIALLVRRRSDAFATKADPASRDVREAGWQSTALGRYWWDRRLKLIRLAYINVPA
jgi:hypothetical protein